MTSVENAGRAFADLHTSGCFLLGNAWDVGSARVLESAGCKAIGTTSAGYAWSLGRKDGSLTRDEVLANAKALADGTTLPVSADLMDGFGPEPETVAETIRDAAALGLAGGSIEDTTGDRENPLYDFTLSVERVRAAVEAVEGLDEPFVFCARADGLFAGRDNFDDVLRRLQAYDDAGAHVLYAPALMTLARVKDVLDAVSAPVNVLAGIGNEGSMKDLAMMGVRRISVGSSFYGHVAGALHRSANELLQDGTFGWAKDRMPYLDLQMLMDG